MKTITILQKIKTTAAKITVAKTVFSALMFCLFIGIGDSVQGAVINAASCSYADVSAAIDSASPGDTVIVPSGTATWNDPLVITKGLTLQGAGIGNTNITGNVDDKFSGMIGYFPDAAALIANDLFRITGFNLDADNKSNVIYLRNKTATILNKIRIDHNRIINPGGTDAGRGIYFSGTFYGVIDNNIVEGTGHLIDSYGASATSWANLSRDFGNKNNIYVEDNILVSTDIVFAAGHGGRYASRYNTIYGAEGNVFPLYDLHGNQPSSYGTMVGEIYGNDIDLDEYGGCLVDHRGGQALVFFNEVTQTEGGSVTIKVREEYNDTIYPEDNPFLMHVTNSYYWNNRRYNDNLITTYIGQDDFDGDISNDPPVLVENREFFSHNIAFDGTSGVGCGTLAAMPVTCTVGVGYWATDQSCTDLTGMTGANPENPISGTLYKCTATDTWTAYYTPYTYPHPLREELGPNTTPPSRSNPDNFTLQQNYPNPFNPSTTIEYTVAKPCNVQIIIYNRLGQEIHMLVNERKPAGKHNISWDGKDTKGNKLASGIYFYRLTAGNQVDTKKMLYLQ